jgi:hypothetical protein
MPVRCYGQSFLPVTYTYIMLKTLWFRHAWNTLPF